MCMEQTPSYNYKYVFTAAIFIVIDGAAFTFMWGNPFLIFSRETGIAGASLWVLPLCIAGLGFVKSNTMRITSFTLLLALTVLMFLNAFVFGFVRF